MEAGLILGCPSGSCRPSGDSSLHSGAEPDLQLQTGLVLHAAEAGRLPAVRTTAPVPPGLRRGQTRYAARARGPQGPPWASPSWVPTHQPGLGTWAVASRCLLPRSCPPLPVAIFPPACRIRHLPWARPWGVQRGIRLNPKILENRCLRRWTHVILETRKSRELVQVQSAWLRVCLCVRVHVYVCAVTRVQVCSRVCFKGQRCRQRSVGPSDFS